jgi:iron complex transport system substrate-binding protein
VRVVSLLPSATEIVFALGLGDDLVGVSGACDYPPETAAIPVVTREVVDADGSRTQALDVAALVAARPDLILAGGHDLGGAPGYRQVSDAARTLEGDVTVISLEPSSVEGVLNSIQTVGAMTEAEDEAVSLVEELRERLRAVGEIVASRRDHGFAPPRLVALERLDPPFAVGRWVPEQVRRAGGWELLGREGEPPAETTWAAIREMDPEIIVLMPRGLHLPQTVATWEALAKPPGWDALRAVRDGRVHAVDGSGYFSRPGPRIVDGIELLAEIIDPLAFDGISPPDSWVRVD